MHKPLFALAAVLLTSPAWSDTLVTNVNGIQIGADGEVQHFTGLLIGDDGKVRSALTGPPPPKTFEHTVDGGGRTLMPGLIDAHGHVLGLGLIALQLDLAGTTSLADLQQRLRAYAAAHPDARWIIGRGWNHELWPDKRFPTAADLDAIVPDRPVWLARVDGHAAVANSAALRAAGVTQETKAPPGGHIENGLFVDAARQLIDKTVPPPTPAELDQALAKAQEILLSYGVTSVGSMSTSLVDW
jgi:predicted amidohydrolase YtcJ